VEDLDLAAPALPSVHNTEREIQTVIPFTFTLEDRIQAFACLKNVHRSMHMIRRDDAQGVTCAHTTRAVRKCARLFSRISCTLHAMQGNSKGMVSTSTVALVPTPMTGP
jgi:hypothetical protein